MVKVSPSILACDFSRMLEEVNSMKISGADMIHLDVMDGVFVNNISFGIPVIASLRKDTDMFFDVHLMINAPERYIERFADAGSDMITFHFEATADPSATLDLIHRLGKKAGISVKPNTSIELIYPLLEKCDMVLVMTVEPGFGGQELIPETIDKVRELKREIEKRNLEVLIQVDGGINGENAHLVTAAGADIIVSGSYIFKADDRKAAINSLRYKWEF